MATLYISYDGVLEPLGESQVVTYLERLASEFSITLLSFEKAADLKDIARVSAMQDRLGRRGISWIRLRYHRRPAVVSTLWDVLSGIVHARRCCRLSGVEVIHARSYVSSLIALGSRGTSRARYLFDMRGFWVDEKVEAGHWPAGGALYRVGKFWERRFFRAADAIVSLTAAGVRAFPTLGYAVSPTVAVAVIPTCVDLARFTPSEKNRGLLERLGLTGALVVGSVGTLSNWYLRTETLSYLASICREYPRAKVLMVTREDHEALRRDAVAAGIANDRLVLTETRFADMPQYTALFDLGVFFIRPALSKRGSAATKLAEFLACGVPVVINAGVGDSGEIVKSHRVGVVLEALDEVSVADSLRDVRRALDDKTLPARCRDVATAVFDIDVGVSRYCALYRSLLEGR